jgi:hypothetical protein
VVTLAGNRGRDEFQNRPETEIHPDPDFVSVRVVHADLGDASAPVLVGHYEGDLLVGAEAYLDRRLGRRLAELQRLELYPAEIETAAVVLNETSPDGRGAHPGAVVAGLGAVGDLTPGRLRATLAYALTAYGAECAARERRRRQREPAAAAEPGALDVPIAAVLVGSGEAGVSLMDSVHALLGAVADANVRLAEGADVGPAAAIAPRICLVDIVELYEDRAIEAVYALRALHRAQELAGTAITDVLVPGRGGQRRVRVGPGPSWWHRLRVTAHEGGGWRFESLTRLARADATLHPAQRALIDALVDEATRSSCRAAAPLGQTLFELLMPNEFKTLAPDGRKLVLVVDREAAALPWEMLEEGHADGGLPLSVASGMVRQLVVERRRERVWRAPCPTALVVGDPDVDDPAFPAMPGASAEAAAVATQLRGHGFDVTALTGPSASPLMVMSALHGSPWRILHLAAHGVFRFAPGAGRPPVTGLVLGRGTFLTPAEAAQMRHVPELVFVNCCHLGQTVGPEASSPPFHRLAASLAVEFIEMGARAVVAAGWAVQDGAARTFATTFYGGMLSGTPFGDAVALARRCTFERHPGANTWGAYQCYGDPSFSLADSARLAPREPPAAAIEVAALAAEIAREAAGADAPARQALLADLDATLSHVPEGWWREPGLRAAAAEALAALDQFEDAATHYEALLAADPADVPLAALEHFVALKLRWADSLDAGGKGSALASRLRSEAERLLNHLTAIGDTATRRALRDALAGHARDGCDSERGTGGRS